MGTVFPSLAPYRVHVPSFGTLWGFIIAGNNPFPIPAKGEEIDRRIAERVTRPLRFYDGATHAGLFSMPKYIREALAAEERLITKDNPLYAV